MSPLHLVVPGEVDDPTAPSGGNTYDRRLRQGLTESGWSVRQHAAAGAWPQPAAADRAELARTLATIPDDAVVLLDGLVACAAPDIVVPESRRLRLVVLVHLPLGDETGHPPETATDLDTRERQTLRAVAAVIATSDWAAQRLIHHHRLPATRVHVAAPGVDSAPLAPGTDGASQLLCVAAITPRKGQDLLVEALARITDRSWNCTCVGGSGRAAAYIDRVRGLVRTHRLNDRIQLVGPRTGADLAASYATADLLVLASHTETYGMVVTEALARGIPVVATQVGGVPEALSRAPDGTRPGLMVPPADPTALADGLRRWLDDPATRRRLRAAAQARRATLPGWQATVAAVTSVLAALAPVPGRVG